METGERDIMRLTDGLSPDSFRRFLLLSCSPFETENFVLAGSPLSKYVLSFQPGLQALLTLK